MVRACFSVHDRFLYCKSGVSRFVSKENLALNHPIPLQITVQSACRAHESHLVFLGLAQGNTPTAPYRTVYWYCCRRNQVAALMWCVGGHRMYRAARVIGYK